MEFRKFIFWEGDCFFFFVLVWGGFVVGWFFFFCVYIVYGVSEGGNGIGNGFCLLLRLWDGKLDLGRRVLGFGFWCVLWWCIRCILGGYFGV